MVAESGAVLGRGVNLGNALDVDKGGAPGLPLREEHFDAVAEAGFDTVRLPVKWSAHTGAAAPYPVDAGFAERVDEVVGWGLDRGLAVVLDVHHYHEVQQDPGGHGERLVGLWGHLARRYRGHPAGLHLELLNEPRERLNPKRWNALLREVLAAVREHDPSRKVLIGPAWMNSVNGLSELDIPDDRNVIATVHYYEPMEFTHQGAHWVDDSEPWLGATWDGEAARERVSADLAGAAEWAAERGVPLFLGEFGAYERADADSRVRWTSWVRAEAERLGIAWCYWDFGTDFGVFDQAAGTWREPLLAALLDRG